jgi:hypothetical protein
MALKGAGIAMDKTGEVDVRMPCPRPKPGSQNCHFAISLFVPMSAPGPGALPWCLFACQLASRLFPHPWDGMGQAYICSQ